MQAAKANFGLVNWFCCVKPVDYDGAKAASSEAKKLNIIGIVFGSVVSVLVIVIFCIRNT